MLLRASPGSIMMQWSRWLYLFFTVGELQVQKRLCFSLLKIELVVLFYRLVMTATIWYREPKNMKNNIMLIMSLSLKIGHPSEPPRFENYTRPIFHLKFPLLPLKMLGILSRTYFKEVWEILHRNWRTCSYLLM